MEELTKQQPGGAASYTDKLSKYLIVYVAILILAGLQFVIAYQHVDVGTMIFRMFAIAFLEAGLAVVFFMHLGSENRVFVTWVALVTLFVFAALQYSWTDSYRMERDSPEELSEWASAVKSICRARLAQTGHAGCCRRAGVPCTPGAFRTRLCLVLHASCCFYTALHSSATQRHPDPGDPSHVPVGYVYGDGLPTPEHISPRRDGRGRDLRRVIQQSLERRSHPHGSATHCDLPAA